MSTESLRWQYRVVNLGMFNAPQRLTDSLGRLGAEGWELVHVYDKASNWFSNMEKGFVLFKRPVPPGSEPDGPWATWESATVQKPGSPSGYDDDYAANPY